MGQRESRRSGSTYMAARDRNMAVSPLVSSGCAQSLWRAITMVGPSFLLLSPPASVPGPPLGERSQPWHGGAPPAPPPQAGHGPGLQPRFLEAK